MSFSRTNIRFVLKVKLHFLFILGNIVLSTNNIFKINLIQLHALNRSLCLPQSLSGIKFQFEELIKCELNQTNVL